MFDDFYYSVDMVRLYVELRPGEFQLAMDKLRFNPYVEYREMKSIKAYRHNFYIKGTIFSKSDLVNVGFDEYDNIYEKDQQETYSFWLGAEHNARCFDKNLIDVVIQYNPNKCSDSEILKYLLDNLFLNNPLTVVKEIDFAIDIPTNITNVKLIRDLRSSFRVIDNGSDDLTYYMRKRGSNGHIKLYNKARENKEQKDKTRFEITLKVNTDLRFMDNYEVDIGLFPDLIVLGDNEQLEFNSEPLEGVDKVLTLACIDNPSYLKELPYRRRKKIEGYMKTLGTNIEFKNCTYIKNTIQNYFNSISQK